MSGAGIGSAGSMIQQAWDFITSLPDVLVYGMAVVLGLIVLKGLWPSPTSAPTGRPVAATSPAASSSSSDQDSSYSGTAAAADDASSKAETEEESAAAAGSTAGEDQSTSPSENELQEEPVQPSSDPMDPPIANPEQTVIDETHDHSIKDTKDQVYLSRSGTPHQHRTGRGRRKKPATRGVRDGIPTRTQVRRHLIDGIDVNSGVEPISTDYTWSVAELDLGVSGASVDAGGELISVDALPSAVSYDVVDSPVDVSSPSILRLLLRTIAPSSPSEQQTDPPETQSPEPRESRRDASNEFHQQRTHAAPQQDYHEQDSRYGSGTPQRERQRQDQAPTTNEPLDPRTSRASNPSQQRPPVNQTLDNGRSPEATRTSPGFDEPGSAGNQYESALDPPTVDDIFSGPYLQPWEQEETTAGTKPDSSQQKRRNERTVGADYQYSPRQPTLPQISPLSVDIHEERSQERPGVDPAAPFRDVGNPLTEMGHGLEALGIDSKQVGTDPAGLAPMLDDDPPDAVGDMLGLGEVADRFEDEPLVPGLATDAEPLLSGIDATGEAWPDETIRF